MERPTVGWLKRERDLFKEYLKFWKSVTGGLATLVAGLPVAGLKIDDLAPPGPQWGTIVPTLLALVVVVLLFFGRESLNRARSTRTSWLLFGLGVIALIAYVWALAALVATVNEERHVLGFSLTNEAQEVLRTRKVGSETPRDLLDYFGHSSEDRIWRYRAGAQALLFALFCAPFVLISSGLALRMVRSFMVDSASRTEAPSRGGH